MEIFLNDNLYPSQDDVIFAIQKYIFFKQIILFIPMPTTTTTTKKNVCLIFKMNILIYTDKKCN